MANRTVRYALSVHGTNPQYLIEKIIRERIYDCRYWQEDCFMLTSAMVLERAVDDLKYIGGTYGAKIDPTPFLCLVLKLLQIQPEKEIVHLFIEQTDFKYLRALGVFYLRLVGTPTEVYTKLEPIYNDYRKLRAMDTQRKFSILHMDELIDSLLREDKVFGITLPRLTKRTVLEENRDIEPYRSELEEQNLIPKQLIEEEVERQRDEERRRRHGHHESSSRYEHRSRDQDKDLGPRMKDDYRRSSRRGDRKRDHDRFRSRSSSPPKERQEAKPVSSKYVGNKGKFSQAYIDSENAIRAKVGLRPLK